MVEIIFTVTESHDSGGYVAVWNDPLGGGITTEGETLAELERNVLEAFSCHFDEDDSRRKYPIRLHFISDPHVVVR